MDALDRPDGRRRTTVHDVARAAGVSLATVDRVLNGRPGVSAETSEKVGKAIAELGFRRDLSASLLARARDLSVSFLIPQGGNEFMQSLTEAVARHGRALAGERMHVATVPVRPLDAADLAAKLGQLNRQTCDCAVIVGSDAPAVRRAVEAATRGGIAVMTLVSDLPGSARRLFIGIDNVAAGRTAASLMGRFVPKGKVALVAGSLELTDHAERLAGFRAVAETDFPGLELIGPVEGHDEGDETGALVEAILSEHPDLVGLYNLGAGNAGLVAALERSGRAGTIRVIAHELSGPTRAALRAGSIDVVLDQNPDGEIGAALTAARGLASGAEFDPGRREPIEIGIFLRDNLR